MKNLFKFGLSGVLLLMLAFILQNCEATKSVASKVEDKELASKLTGVWTLKTINSTDVADAFKGTMPTLTFDFETHRVSGNAGCNNYNGGFVLLGNIFTPSPMVSTKMFCNEENQEAELLKLLGEKSTLIFNNYNLQFVQNGKVVLEFIPRAR